VTWSHDAARLASASDDKTVKIWNPATGQCVSTLMFSHPIKEVQFYESNPNYLHTERGTFDVTNLSLDPASGQPLSPKPVGYGLSHNNTWIISRRKTAMAAARVSAVIFSNIWNDYVNRLFFWPCFDVQASRKNFDSE